MRKLPLLLWTFVLPTVIAGSLHADDWPQWRGPRRDAVSRETGLLKSWPEGGPQIAWQVENAGIAYSSVAVANGRVYTQGDLDGVEHIICWDEKDGSLLWAVQPEPVKRQIAERIENEFTRFDKNGDGVLDELEALNGLGWDFNQIDQEEDGDAAEIARKRVAAFFKALDKNEDGRLDDSEAPAAMYGEFSKIDAEDKEVDQMRLAGARAKDYIADLDSDLDFKISRKEANNTLLARLFNRIDQKDPKTGANDNLLTEDELREFFFASEPGRDGELTVAELESYYVRNFPRRDGRLQKADLLKQYGGYRNSYGDGPRGTPTVEGDFVYVEGGNGDLTCLEAASGRTVWHVNLAKDLGGGRPGWGYAESPLIVDDWIVVTPGGKNGTIAVLNKKDGSLVWRSTEMTQSAHYSSPQVAEIAGVRQIVQFSRESLYGLSLSDGKPLWSYRAANNGTANIATPIVSGNFVLASSGYGTGAGLVQVTSYPDGRQQADEVYFEKRLANHHGGLVKVGDYVYGFGAGLMCMHYFTGEIAWQARSVGKGSLIYADGMLYCLGERHEVALVEATPEEYREHGRFSIENLGRSAWAHPVVANGRLYIRNLGRLTAYDIRAE